MWPSSVVTVLHTSSLALCQMTLEWQIVLAMSKLSGVNKICMGRFHWNLSDCVMVSSWQIPAWIAWTANYPVQYVRPLCVQIGVRSPAGARDFFSILCVQTGSKAHPDFCTMGTRGPFPGGEVWPRHDADNPTHLVLRSWMSRRYISSPPKRIHGL
jgi:hypothetical protein